MGEGLWKRVGRIVSGSVNTFVSSLEGAAPESVMEESIREVVSTMDDVRDELGRVVAEKHLASKRLMDMNKKHEELAGQIEIAVKEGRDDLAEAAISKQMDIEVQIPILEGTISDSAAQEKELEGYISALKAQEREMADALSDYRKAMSEKESGRVPTMGAETQGNSDFEKRVGNAQATFDRVFSKASGGEDAAVHSSRQEAVKLAELEDMARRNRVQERLAAIKGGGGNA